MLDDARRSDRENPFVGLGQLIDYNRAMHVSDNITLAWFGRMLDAGLCLSYDPTITTIGDVHKIELSAAGYQHLRWGTRDVVYTEAMLEVTPIVDQEVFDHMNSMGNQSPTDRRQHQLKAFAGYLAADDAKYCKVPDHEAYASQRRLTTEMLRMPEKLGPLITEEARSWLSPRANSGAAQRLPRRPSSRR